MHLLLTACSRVYPSVHFPEVRDVALLVNSSTPSTQQYLELASIRYILAE